jgi:glycosyltransferase involved in cell wall biosynthesis
MSEIIIVSNDKFFLKKKMFFNSNKNTFTIINCFNKLKKIFLIARVSKKKLKFGENIKNIQIVSFLKIFRIKNQIKNKKTLIISLTPYNFLIIFFLIAIGVDRKKMYLFLRSDGFYEYSIKFGIIGKFIYGIMLNFLKKRVNILTCSTSLTHIHKSRLIYPSEITNQWLNNRKAQNKKKSLKKKIKLMYLGRLRKEKGYSDLLELFNQLKINASLSIVGNDFKYLKKKDYPKNRNIRIFGQVSSLKTLIKHYDNTDIFILPSYSEAYPQVILESFSRLKPVIIFNEIKFLKKNFSYGLFNCDRNIKSFEKTIIKIIENYRYIQSNILKIKIHTQKNFQTRMYNVIKEK